jgi:hypothetical protein
MNLQAFDIVVLEFWVVSFSRRLLYTHRKFYGSHWIYLNECQNRESNRSSADRLHLACSLYGYSTLAPAKISLLTYLLIYLLTYLLHGAESFLGS